ncbi:MAG: hypothetical protein K8H87_13550 [Pseudorhodoplanes sp.]|nr:hypothetical protein [Pseudorhodoplanes sp.]
MRHLQGIDLTAIDQDDVLFVRRPRIGGNIESEAPQRVEKQSPSHPDDGCSLTDSIVERDGLGLCRRQLGMGNNPEFDKTVPVAVIVRL